MASVEALPDLPMAWLHRLSTTLTAESAARLRSTCKLLREVIDATWEPDAPVPPHRRSVPLTLEQVQAQLPPAQPRPYDAESSWWYSFSSQDSYDKCDGPERDGCHPHWLEVFGPALTRLTANQALNLLKGKPVISFLGSALSSLNKHSSVAERMQLGVLSELVFNDPNVEWPPRNHNTAEAEDNPNQDASWMSDRGICGWDDDECVCQACSTPAALLLKWGRRLGSGMQPHCVDVTTEDNTLLVTTESSCRQATLQEVQQFVASDAPEDGDRFDVYLSINDGNVDGPADIYVFLGPVEPRLTGRPKPMGAAPQGPCDPLAAGQPQPAAGDQQPAE